METLVLAFLLAYAGGDEETRRRLRSALTLYRENRDLLHALAETPKTTSDETPAQGPARPVDDAPSETPSPQGELDVLMRYLSGRN